MGFPRGKEGFWGEAAGLGDKGVGFCSGVGLSDGVGFCVGVNFCGEEGNFLGEGAGLLDEDDLTSDDP